MKKFTLSQMIWAIASALIIGFANGFVLGAVYTIQSYFK
jgi:hypothetical protein